jgi:pimeloyl-ACP methyl ester carboxylesterase
VTDEPGRRRAGRTALLVAAGLGVAAAGAVATERALIRRARSRPDPERGEPLSERPGPERRVASFDGTELAVHEIGPADGPVLVFAHGFTLDLTAWHFQWKDLCARYRCVLYDQRGHGRSDPAAGGDYSLEAMGRDLKAVLDATAPATAAAAVDAPVVLLGHSLGGMAAVAFAELFPEEMGGRVRAVVLANTAVGDVFKAILGNLGARSAVAMLPALRRLLADPARAYRLRARALGSGADLAFLVARITNFGPTASPTLVDHVVSVAARAPAEVWTDVMASLLTLDLGRAVEHVRVPVLVVASDLDRLTPAASARALASRLPDARLVVIEGAGHCAMLEHHELFDRAVEAFLEEVLGARAGAGASGTSGTRVSGVGRA